MHIKSFEGVSIADAIKSVKREFGNKAVIMNTLQKTNDVGGAIYEVLAGIPEMNSGEAADKVEDELFFSLHHLQLDVTSLKKELLQLKELVFSKDDLIRIEDQMAEMKMLFYKTTDSKWNRLKNEDDVLLLKRLTVLGIENPLLQKLAAFLEDSKNTSRKTADKFAEWVMDTVKLRKKWLDLSNHPAMMFVHGYPGSGKTTYLLKLVHALRKKFPEKKYAIAHIGPARGAEHEKMKFYAKVWELPFLSATNLEEWKNKAKDQACTYLVEVDFSMEESQRAVQNLATVFEEWQVPVEHFVTVSATDSTSMQHHSVRHFSQMGINHLAVTKSDLHRPFGSVVNLSGSWSIPVMHLSGSKQVDRGIEKLSYDKLIERILRS